MKKLFILAICCFSYFPAVNACDYPMPEIKTSEFIFDKTVFWGRATAKKWDRHTKMSVEDDFPTSTYSTYLDVTVFRTLKGNVDNSLKVWLSETSCGIDVPLGKTILFVVKPIGKSDYYADQLTSSIASDRAVISLLKLGIDVQVGGWEYPPEPGWLESKYWKKWLKDCESDEAVFGAPPCLSLDVLKQISDAYETEYEDVRSIPWPKRKTWWARFRK